MRTLSSILVVFLAACAGGGGGSSGSGGQPVVDPCAGKWCPVVLPQATGYFSGIHGVSASDIWMVGGSGTFHFDGTAWERHATSDELFNVWEQSPTQIYATFIDTIMQQSGLKKWSGTSWSSEFTWGQGTIDVHMTGSNSGWASANTGKVLRLENGTWAAKQTPATVMLTAIWPLSDSNVWAVGQSGASVHFTGTWAFETIPGGANAASVWATPSGVVWAAGQNGSVHRHGNAGSWVSVPSGVDVALNKIWGFSDDDIWIVGAFGTILHWDGSTFTTEQSGTMSPLNCMWGSSPDDLWIGGDNGVLLRRKQ